MIMVFLFFFFFAFPFTKFNDKSEETGLQHIEFSAWEFLPSPPPQAFCQKLLPPLSVGNIPAAPSARMTEEQEKLGGC